MGTGEISRGQGVILVAFIGFAMLAQSRAAAEVVFTSLGAGDTYDSLNGNPIDGPATPEPFALAQAFVPNGSSYLDSVDFGLSWNAGSPNVRVEVFADSGGVPGSLLETSQVSNFTSGIVSANFGGSVILTGGSDYWLGVFADGASQLTWHDSLSPVFATQAITDNNGATWLPVSSDPFSGAAFRINGTSAESTDVPLIDVGQAWRFLPGLAEPSVGMVWTTATFDDTSWNFDLDGFGYDEDVVTQAGLMSKVATPLPGMRDNGVNADAHTTLYLRRGFTVDNPLELSELVLSLDYDDSFIAYINGVEVARSAFGTVGTPEIFDALGNVHESTNGDPSQSLERFVINLVDDFPGLLTGGSDNVLAIQGLNASLDDDDFVLSQISLGGNRFNVLLAGDYNVDGTVDAADYTIWRDNLGAAAGSLPNDIDGGIIGQAQYTTWVGQFGQSLSGSATIPASMAVPEPSSVVSLFVVLLTLAYGSRVAA